MTQFGSLASSPDSLVGGLAQPLAAELDLSADGRPGVLAGVGTGGVIAKAVGKERGIPAFALFAHSTSQFFVDACFQGAGGRFVTNVYTDGIIGDHRRGEERWTSRFRTRRTRRRRGRSARRGSARGSALWRRWGAFAGNCGAAIGADWLRELHEAIETKP